MRSLAWIIGTLSGVYCGVVNQLGKDEAGYTILRHVIFKNKYMLLDISNWKS